MAPVSFDNYTVTGDVGVIGLCTVIVILLTTSFVARTRSFRIFLNIIGYLYFAASANIVYHVLIIERAMVPDTLIYVFRIVYQSLLLAVLFLFALYTTEVSGMDRKKAKAVALVCISIVTAVVTYDIVRTVLGYGFRITEDGTAVNQTNVYTIGFVLFVIIIAVIMSNIRHLVYKRVLYGFYGIMTVSIVIRFLQLIFKQASLTTLTYMFPVVAMLYIMHSNPYNITTGAVDKRALESMVQSMYENKASFVFLSLLLPDFDDEGKEIPADIRAIARKFSVKFFKKCVLFQISNGHVVLMAPKSKNPDYEEKIRRILDSFQTQYKRFRYPYKIVVGESVEDISRRNEYVSLIQNVEHRIPENTVCRIGQKELDNFNRDVYILRELTDIYRKRDINDPRVLAYCQPVFNIKTGLFDTAEALMRLELNDTGIIPPDLFIPLAEQHGYIHVLTEIILNKTCSEIKKLMDDGFKINRISVNISALELKDEGFCSDINSIIEKNKIPGDKIAIELTESGNEEDFMIMKEKIEELRGQGIQFYLDDFGTGYSNMQRIMELPFDIIKFDKSLVIASGTGERSERIVENLAHIFKDMDYSILYEGVEDETDETRCKHMFASYLQGFKYSRPVPIERLRDSLLKTV